MTGPSLSIRIREHSAETVFIRYLTEPTDRSQMTHKPQCAVFIEFLWCTRSDSNARPPDS